MASQKTKRTTQLESTYFAYSDWLSNVLIPFWFQHGFDASGGSVESFNGNGEINIECSKRSRVQARQLFVVAYAHTKGWTSHGREIAGRITAFLEQLHSQDHNGFYPHLLAQDNSILDNNADLYDCAFFLLAYAWQYKAFGDFNALKKADQLIASIEHKLRASCGGWQEGSYPHEIRRQNPHMHLFEAFMGLYEVTGSGKWLAYAGEMLSLFESRLYDEKHQVVREFFTHDWQLHSGKGHIVEPGHMVEWVWLLERYSSLTQKPLTHYSHALYNNAMTIGFPGTKRIMVNAVTAEGSPIDPTQRLWPMTEWLKASLTLSMKSPEQTGYISDAITAATSLMENFTNPMHPNQYIDKLSADHQIIDDSMPASTLYHLVTAHQVFSSYIERHF